MEVRERLARLVLHNASAATHAARKLRQGSELELRLEPTATGSLQLMASHDGRLLGRVEPIPREYIEWIRTCKDNRCTVDSIPVAEQDHLLKLILVRIERGEPLQPQTPAEPDLPPKAKALPAPSPEPEPAPEPEPEPEPAPEPEPEPELEAEPLPVPMPSGQVPIYLDVPRHFPDAYYGHPQPSALRQHGLKVLMVLGFMAFTAAAAAAVHYLNSPCGRLWAKVGDIGNCRLMADHNLHFESSKPNAKQLCSQDVAKALPEVKLMRVTLQSSASPVLVTCRLNK